MSFRWKMADYTGGSTAVHQAYKPFLCLKPDDYATGEFLVQPRDTSDITITCGFTPDVLVLISFRPKNHASQNDVFWASRGGGMTFGVAGSNGSQFTGSTRIKHGWDIGEGIKLWREDVCFSVCSKDRSGIETGSIQAIEILTLDVASWDATGVTLSVSRNWYDDADYVAWLALKGTFKVGVMDAGDATITTGSWKPKGAMFLSTKRLASEPFLDEYNANGCWDHMTGFASEVGNGQASIWGGTQRTSWNWTTERWSNRYAITLAKAASSSYFTGATVQTEGKVTAWREQSYVLGVGQNDAGLDFQWYTFDGNPYRIGYVVTGELAEEGVLETNWNRRPGGSENTPGLPAQSNEQVTAMLSPEVILMAATNYNFSYSDSDPMNFPRSSEPDGSYPAHAYILPGWGSGGSGGLGWHVAPFSELGYDAYGVHTFGGGVAERGHDSHSGTQYMRRWILAGQGANSTPPAYHNHSVNVVYAEPPLNPVVGMNWRYAKHADQRGHVGEA